jgi:hypothetical protein
MVAARLRAKAKSKSPAGHKIERRLSVLFSKIFQKKFKVEEKANPTMEIGHDDHLTPS